MLKSRSFWTGIGMGLVIGTLLLQMMNIGAASQLQEPFPPSSEQLHNWAQEAGYVLQSADEQWFSEADVDEAVAAAVYDALTERESTEPEVSARAFLILPGMTSEQVADMLLQLSLIRDRAHFLEMMTEQSLHNKIRAGLYTFAEDVTAEELIEQITH